jgi:hypothetical protein
VPERESFQKCPELRFFGIRSGFGFVLPPFILGKTSLEKTARAV